METLVAETFGKRLRIRVCGLLIENDQLLLIKHNYIGDLGYLWVPPGGGMQYGENAKEALKREFMEETGIDVYVGELAYVYEFLESPLHAIELFFWVCREGEEDAPLLKGTDPELPLDQQIIVKVAFLSLEQLTQEEQYGLHNSLRFLKSWQDLRERPLYS